MSVKLHLLCVLAAMALMGCQQNATEPATGDAEVPQPGPAIEDPGPAPTGQWEPPMESGESAQGEATTDPASAETPDAAADQSPSPAGEAPDDAAEAGTESSANEGEAAEKQSNPVTLKLQPWEETEKLIASHKGKVVVVDFWSTSCLPCRREFPHLVALQKAHPQKVACVSVSLDYTGRKSRPPETYRDSVLEFLNEQQATIDNVLSTDDPDELEQRLELAPIPLVWVYDGEGQRRQTFDNGDLEGEEFTYEEDVVPFVESLLSES